MKKRKNKKTELAKEGLWEEGIKYKEPLKYAEFKCPRCRGVATVGTFNGLTTVECHACGLKRTKGSARW